MEQQKTFQIINLKLILSIKKLGIMKSLSKITDTSHTINADLNTIRL